MPKIAAVQMDIAWEDPRANFEGARRLVAEAAAEGARLVVLPEMFATGFSMRANAVAIHAEATRAFLSELASDRGVWLLAGLAEPGADAEPTAPHPRNAASLFDPDGREALRYHKMHPFSYAEEHLHYAAGDRLCTIDIEGIRVTPLICYDLRFPEAFRARADRTDLYAVIANWPAARREHWMSLLGARAIENQAYVLGVNRVGEGDGLSYSGDSGLYTPLGNVERHPSDEEGILLASVDPEEVRRVRRRFSFLADRRPLSDYG